MVSKDITDKNREELIKQARDGLKLSFKEKLGLFLPRLLVGGLIGRILYPRILQISNIIPDVADSIEKQTRGDIIWQKGDATLYAAPDKGLEKTNKNSAKAKEWFSKPTRTALLASAAISVGIGAISTIRSINRYKKEQKFLEKLYTDKLDSLKDGETVPKAPTKDDLKNLHKWRSHARNKMNQRDAGDAVEAASFHI